MFKNRILNGQVLHGMIVTLNVSSVAEALSACGLDWLWIDMEHAPLTLSDVQHMVQAKKEGCAALVRIPENTDQWIKQVLDLGAEGIIVPHVNTQAEAMAAVQSSLYPPEGSRSLGCSRANLYGMDAEYKRQANAKRLVFAQIEHREGVENIDEIVPIPGLDGIIIGPYDLSGSYGKLGLIEDGEVLEAIDKVLNACKRFQKPAGIFAKEREHAARYLQQGFQLVATGIDILYLWRAAQETLTSLALHSGPSEARRQEQWPSSLR
jgi:2-keto-3-deoxy-L-rhamnonate aldolase RhmA